VSEGYRVEVDAVVLRSYDQPMAVERIRLRDVGPGEVRVRVDATGVCHTDLSLAHGVIAHPLPAVLGHEASGTVLETGAGVTGLSAGDRVILLFIAPCGHCPACERGEPWLCVNGANHGAEPYALDAAGEPVYPGLGVGSFAEQTVVPATAAVKVPDDISSDDAALLGCAVTTGVGAVTKTAPVTPGASVLVIGLGGVGLAAIQGAKLAGASQIIAVDRNPEKAALAIKLGADHFVPADNETKKAVRALTGDQGADYAFDCVGTARTIRDAWSMARRGGTACVVGVGGKDDMVTFSALELFYFARTLVGSVAGSLDATKDFPWFFEHVRTGRLDLAAMVTAHGGLPDVEHAMQEMAAAHGIRTVITPGDAR
jgi:S-(hydroxymethyl)glutathione dehydrogenase/alcohol dehydrogenase